MGGDSGRFERRKSAFTNKTEIYLTLCLAKSLGCFARPSRMVGHRGEFIPVIIIQSSKILHFKCQHLGFLGTLYIIQFSAVSVPVGEVLAYVTILTVSRFFSLLVTLLLTRNSHCVNVIVTPLCHSLTHSLVVPIIPMCSTALGLFRYFLFFFQAG